MKIKSNLISDVVSSNTREAQDVFANGRFGEKEGEKIIYSLSEAFFLFKEGKMEIFDKRDKILGEKEIEKKFARIDKKFAMKYFVFRDLRKKGYIVKGALKFGAEFRVYEKGDDVGKDHSKWLCFVSSENSIMTWQEFSAKNRVAHSTKKSLLIAIVDEEGDVLYYEVNWLRL